MAAITLENVRKVYQLGETKVEALRGSDVSIEEGEFVAIMGPSGSGKSTLMNMIGALDIPTDGEVNIDGEEIGEMTEDELALLRSRKIGFDLSKSVSSISLRSVGTWSNEQIVAESVQSAHAAG